jgi:hypothetical protein
MPHVTAITHTASGGGSVDPNPSQPGGKVATSQIAA